MSLYEIVILGDDRHSERARLKTTLVEMLQDLDLQLGREVTFREHADVQNRDNKAATGCVYFGGAPGNDIAIVERLIYDGHPVIPVICDGQTFDADIPESLRPLNGVKVHSKDPQLVELSTALLECVGLLRRQRRVFISYRRTEARRAAQQLHDELAAKGFDVFLDTHDIRPAEPFQDVLFHRLCDSDVMVMLDTPSYAASRWTQLELGRALAKEIHILRVVWPDHTPSPLTSMSQTLFLAGGDISSATGEINSGALDQILLAVERIRSRSIAVRYRSIAGKLRADMARINAKVEGRGAHGAIAIEMMNQKKVWAYPVVGIPTAETLHDVAEKASMSEQSGLPILVYDHVGIHDAWATHLKWLDAQIQCVRAVKVSDAAYDFVNLGC
ncbi:MAG: toll/interleukin-1 receptor domain-containing protein [Afipia sp.]|nr:toll/interleukin-1 receptor domain-containing protein [Afipia sp.]